MNIFLSCDEFETKHSENWDFWEDGYDIYATIYLVFNTSITFCFFKFQFGVLNANGEEYVLQTTEQSDLKNGFNKFKILKEKHQNITFNDYVKQSKKKLKSLPCSWLTRLHYFVEIRH